MVRLHASLRRWAGWPALTLSANCLQKIRGCRTSLLHQTMDLEDLVRIQTSTERLMWCNGSTLGLLVRKSPHKNSRAAGSRLLRPPKPRKGRTTVPSSTEKSDGLSVRCLWQHTGVSRRSRFDSCQNGMALAVIARIILRDCRGDVTSDRTPIWQQMWKTGFDPRRLCKVVLLNGLVEPECQKRYFDNCPYKGS